MISPYYEALSLALMASNDMGLLGSTTGSGGFDAADVMMVIGCLAPAGPFVICLTSVPGPREPGCFRTYR